MTILELLTWSCVIIDENDAVALLHIDRLWLEFTGEELVLRVGRQAISWGNGILFSAFDLFNPFSPTEIDTDYKPGDDLIYSQLLLPGGGDIQALIVARRPSKQRMTEVFKQQKALPL